MKKQVDYPELEGKVFKYIFEAGKEVYAQVVGCNREIGITAINIENPEQFVVCINAKIHNANKWAPVYNGMFDAIVHGIETNYLEAWHIEQYYDCVHIPYHYGSINNKCAFV
jgi:hypothetical protein